MNKYYKLFPLLVAAIILCLPMSLPAYTKSSVKIKILHINDFHGHLLPFTDKSINREIPVGGAAYLAALIEKERSQNPKGTLLLSAGDMFQGSPISNLFKGKPVIEITNVLKFDAMTLGNHEFDWGLDSLEILRKRASFPFLSANIRDDKGKLLSGIKPYIIFKKKGVNIAVIGITTPETTYTTKPNNVKGLIFEEPAKILPGIIREVKAKGAMVIVILSHLGLDADKRLAEEVPGIHVIAGGHSHTTVSNPVLVGDTIIVQAGCYGIYLGTLNLDVDLHTGRILNFTKKGELKLSKAGAKDQKDMKVAKIVDKYDRRIRNEFQRIISSTSVDLKRSDFSESNIGNLICDLLKEATGTEIAFVNGGSIRADIPAGQITMEQAFTILPFDNVLISMDLSGKQIRDILEQSATLHNRIMQVSSGLKVEYDITKPPGSRISKVSLGGQPLLNEKIYRVAANDFLAAGGDHYLSFKEGKNMLYGNYMRDTFISYLKKNSPVNPRIEGRIRVIK